MLQRGIHDRLHHHQRIFSPVFFLHRAMLYFFGVTFSTSFGSAAQLPSSTGFLHLTRLYGRLRFNRMYTHVVGHTFGPRYVPLSAV